MNKYLVCWKRNDVFVDSIDTDTQENAMKILQEKFPVNWKEMYIVEV